VSLHETVYGARDSLATDRLLVTVENPYFTGFRRESSLSDVGWFLLTLAGFERRVAHLLRDSDRLPRRSPSWAPCDPRSRDTALACISLHGDPRIEVSAPVEDSSTNPEAERPATKVTPIAQRGNRAANELRCLGDGQQLMAAVIHGVSVMCRLTGVGPHQLQARWVHR
jgi:hypothetical protein